MIKHQHNGNQYFIYMSTGWTYIYLKELLTDDQIQLVHDYEEYLLSFSQEKGYSFAADFIPAEFNNYAKQQIIKLLGYEIKPKVELFVRGEPMFRAAEALMKYFRGFYITQTDKLIKPYIKNCESYIIRKRNKLGISVYHYHISGWDFIANYFNENDTDAIRQIYDFEAFVFES